MDGDKVPETGGEPAAAPTATAAGDHDPAMMTYWSIEATLPKTDEIDALAALVAPGTEVFLSTLPHVTLDKQVAAARQVRAAGLEPVPHIAARYFADEDALRRLLADMEEAAAIRRILLIAGDADEPKGPFDSALAVIQARVLDDTPLKRIGIAGYPDGHPKIADEILDEALAAKLAALEDSRFQAEIVSQFCFDGKAIARWVGRVRRRWPSVPIRVGMAGPTNSRTLMRYASRCGVKMSLSNLPQRLSMAFRLLKNVAPTPIVRHLDAHYADLSPDGPLIAHFFSFGGLARTAHWAQEAAVRRPRHHRRTG